MPLVLLLASALSTLPAHAGGLADLNLSVSLDPPPDEREIVVEDLRPKGFGGGNPLMLGKLQGGLVPYDVLASRDTPLPQSIASVVSSCLVQTDAPEGAARVELLRFFIQGAPRVTLEARLRVELAGTRIDIEPDTFVVAALNLQKSLPDVLLKLRDSCVAGLRAISFGS